MQINNFTLKTTNPRQLGNPETKTENNNAIPNFGTALSQAFNKVNQSQIKAQDLQLKMITEPESVNAHDVTIAQTQAELALSFTKAISSRLINAFNELTNIR